MTHEPECLAYPDGCCPWMPQPCDCQCNCDALRAAYQRGRGDAASAIERSYMGVQLGDEALGVWVSCRMSARGYW